MSDVIILTILVLLALCIDCRQTLRIKNRPELHEINWLLGRHPSDRKIIIYFLCWDLALVLLVMFCPWQWLTLTVLAAVLAVETWAIRNNLKLNL